MTHDALLLTDYQDALGALPSGCRVRPQTGMARRYEGLYLRDPIRPGWGWMTGWADREWRTLRLAADDQVHVDLTHDATAYQVAAAYDAYYAARGPGLTTCARMIARTLPPGFERMRQFDLGILRNAVAELARFRRIWHGAGGALRRGQGFDLTHAVAPDFDFWRLTDNLGIAFVAVGSRAPGDSEAWNSARGRTVVPALAAFTHSGPATLGWAANKAEVARLMDAALGARPPLEDCTP